LKIKKITSSSDKIRYGSLYSHINPEIVIPLLKEGARLPEIASLYGCSPQTVTYQIKNHIPNFDARTYPKWRLRDITVEKVVRMYNILKSSTKIAKILSTETHVITDRLKSAGVKLRALYREDITVEDVARLYKKHKKTSIVADILNINIPLVRRRLEEAGIELDLSYRNKPRRTDISEKIVLEDYDNGKSIASIAKKQKASHAKIRKIIADTGREIRDHYGCYREDITPQRVNYWYKRLKRISRVAEKLKTDPRVIRDRLKTAGVKIDNSFRNERKRTDIPAKRVVKLHKAGTSKCELARKYKCNRKTIDKIVKDAKEALKK